MLINLNYLKAFITTPRQLRAKWPVLRNDLYRYLLQVNAEAISDNRALSKSNIQLSFKTHMHAYVCKQVWIIAETSQKHSNVDFYNDYHV